MDVDRLRLEWLLKSLIIEPQRQGKKIGNRIFIYYFSAGDTPFELLNVHVLLNFLIIFF